MKKILSLLTIAASLSGISAFAQGNFIFTAPASYVWNQATGTRGGAFNVAFLINTTATSTALVGSPTATNGAPVANGSSWTSILNDPNYALATVSGGGPVAVGTVTSVGGINYNGGSPFLVTGTSAGGGNINVFMIGWDNQYATPAAAAAANANVGWSRVFVYNYANSSSAPSLGLGAYATSVGTPAQFGTQLSPVPEPATFALAGLGAAAMLIARRRK